MSERMRIEIDVETSEALRNLLALAAAMSKYTDVTVRVAAATDTADKAFVGLATHASTTATALNKAGDAGKEAGEKISKGARAGGDGMKEIGGGANLATSAIGALTGSAAGLLAGFASLRTVVTIFDEITESIERAIAANRDLGDVRLSFEQGIQNVIDNLDLSGVTNGRERTGKLVQKFQQETGTNVAQATSIMAATQGSNFDILDPKNEANDGLLPGYEIAKEVAKFAVRMKFDSETAEQSLKLLAAAGVKNVEDAKKIFAQYEAAQRNTAIVSPQQFVAGAIKATAGPISQGVPVSQALGNFAAAAALNTSALAAGTQAEQATRTILGTDDKKRLAMARLAAEQGRINGADFAAADIANPLTEQEEKDLREIADAKADGERIERQRLAGLETMRRNAVSAQQRRNLVDAKKKSDENAAVAAREREQSINDRQSKFDASREESALLSAYESLPLQQQDATLRQALAGKSSTDQQRIIRSVAEGRIAQQVLRMYSPTAETARMQVEKGAARPDTADLDKRNAEFQTSPVAQAQVTANRAQSALLDAEKNGQQYDNNSAALAEADVKILQGNGSGWQDKIVGGVLGTPFYSASTPQRLKLARQLLVIMQDFASFRASLNPRQLAKYGGEVNSLVTELLNTQNAISQGSFSDYYAVPKLARKAGALMSKIRSDALENREPLPATDPRDSVTRKRPDMGEGIRGEAAAIPKNELDLLNSFGRPVPPATQPTTQPIDAGSESMPSAPASGPTTQPVVNNYYNYNTSVGNHFARGGNDLDLPGRLEGFIG